MCLFRFKMWWMTQRMGTWGQEVPIETQFLLIEAHEGSDIDGGINNGIGGENQGGAGGATYVVLLPLLEGDFRAVLQGNDQNEIEICVESGMWLCALQKKTKKNNHKFMYILVCIYVRCFFRCFFSE